MILNASADVFGAKWQEAEWRAWTHAGLTEEERYAVAMDEGMTVSSQY